MARIGNNALAFLRLLGGGAPHLSDAVSGLQSPIPGQSIWTSGAELPITLSRGYGFVFPSISPHGLVLRPGQEGSFDLTYGANPAGDSPPHPGLSPSSHTGHHPPVPRRILGSESCDPGRAVPVASPSPRSYRAQP